MKSKKWLLGLVTFAAMAVLCVVCAGAEEYSFGLWKYTPVGGGEAYITAYSGFDSTLNIPSKLDGYTISGISANAFSNKKGIDKVIIPSSVTYIGGSAFKGSSIKSIDIPSTVTEFGDYWTDASTFENCDSLTTVTINASTDIPNRAFYDCDALKTVTIGNCTTSIGDSVFYDCDSLTSVKLGNSVKSIGSYAFCNTSLKSISFPSSVNYIGHTAFRNTKLTSVNIPSTVSEIQLNTFMDCSDLTYVLFNASTAVPRCGFMNCTSLKSVTISNSTTGIDYRAFDNCKSLRNVIIGNNTQYIGNEAFKDTKSLESVMGGSVLTSIGNSVFENSGLYSYSIPETVTSVGYRAFANSSLRRVEIPSSVVNWKKDYSFYETFGGCDCLVAKIGQASMPDKNLFANTYGVEIYCIPGSEAEAYAKSNGISYFATLKSIKSTSIKLNQKNYNLKAGETLRLYPTVTPQNTTDRIEWISGNTNIATVNGAGVVTGVAEGTVAIQARTTSGVSTTCVIEVSGNAVTSVDKVVKKNISLATISVANQYYTGKAVNPAPTVKYNDITTLQNGYDYTVTYSNNVKVGTAKITIKGIGNYTGTVAKTFNITELPKVSGYKVKSKTSTSVTLQWNKNTTATGYELQKWDGKKWVALTKLTSNATTSYTVKGLKAGTAGYQFRIRAYRTEGKNKAYSGYSATVKVNTNPYGVGGFKCSSKSSTSVTLKWNKGTTASGYQLQQYKNGKWVTIYTGTKATNTSYTVKGLKAGTAGYRFRIRAYKTYGNTKQYGSWSSEVKVNTNPYGVGGFKCSSKSSTSVTLKWNKGTTASGYQLQQYKDGKWVTIYTGTKATNTSYTVKGLKAGTAGYRFRIRAYKTYGSSKQYGSWSSEVKVNTNPYGVGGFKAKSTAKTSITLGWNKGTTASGYQLQQYKGGKWVTVYTGTKATSTSCTVKSLKANTSYKFRIRAYKTYGNTKQYGSWSKELTVKTKR